MWPIFEFQERLQLTTLGLDRWLQLLKANARDRRVWEYQQTHGGLLPPDIIKARRRWVICATVPQTVTAFTCVLSEQEGTAVASVQVDPWPAATRTQPIPRRHKQIKLDKVREPDGGQR
jgi:hypothetical protein